MAKVKSNQENMVFGLDIGTRSIVGTAGYLKGDKFHVVGQVVREHETRAMLDGQIHDIMKVGETIRIVKEELEELLSVKFTEVCIAAAGRVLRTVTVNAEKDFEAETEITNEDIYNLLMDGIERAYAEFGSVNDTNLKFYCVGYTPIRFYMNGYIIGNLEGHRASKISVDMIATFLPDDVVDGLYKAVEYAGLKVANLTLEPIAAIQVAIPEKFRMLNLALVDVGAGTSDISITSGGSIMAYGMIPAAGDGLTDIIVQNCLVDFETAENIKRSSSGAEPIEYLDIMGLPQTIEPSAVLDMLNDKIDEMTSLVADEIMRLNGDKSVSAVFVVGGGGTVPGYTEKLSEKLGIVKERVAIRGKEVMQSIEFENENPIKDSLMVTPIGICLSYYAQSNNFIFVSFNDTRLKLYDNGRLTVSDAAMQTSLGNEDLFPKRGKALTFTVDGKTKMIRGTQGDSCVITINNEPADLHTAISSGDRIVIVPSTAGTDASATLGSLKEMSEPLHLIVNGKNISLPKTATVGGELKDAFYSICEGDEININNFYTVSELGKMLELELKGMEIKVNGTFANMSTRVYENFTLDINVSERVSFAAVNESAEEIIDEAGNEFTKESNNESANEFEDDSNNELDDKSDNENNKSDNESDNENNKLDNREGNVSDSESEVFSDSEAEEEDVKPEPQIHSITVTANGQSVTLIGKKEYVYVDVFDQIDFDLKNPAGRSIVTKLNGLDAEYLQNIDDGDIIEIYWK